MPDHAVATARAQASLARILAVMDQLRDPGGCPWDGEQTLRSLTPYVLEEAHEVVEAVESGSMPHLREELGDLLFQVVFQARITREAGAFDFADVCDGIADKLIRRHPHVFASTTVSGSGEVLKNWELIKAQERKEKGDAPRSAIGGVPVALPALVRAERITEKASAVGFDWADLKDVLAKVREELGELEHELARRARIPASEDAAEVQGRVEAELGDVLFSLANLARFARVHPEEALRGTVRRFERRFHHIEARLGAQGRSPGDSTLAEMDVLWAEAKAAEKA